MRLIFAATCLAVAAGCAMAPLPPAEARHHRAAKELREARSAHASAQQRLGHYLQAAAEASALLGQGAEAPAVRDIYNAATAELTVLLRSADGGLWNHPLTLMAGGTSYQLHVAPASRQEGTWAPAYFTAFETPREVRERRLRLIAPMALSDIKARTSTARTPNSSSPACTVLSTCHKPSRKSNASCICISKPRVVARPQCSQEQQMNQPLRDLCQKRACPECNDGV